jgi:hypothetical protein
MMRALLSIIGLIISVSVASAQAYVQGNDTGGIITWSCESEAAAQNIAADHCAWYGKHHRITGVNRQDGDYISFRCLWEPNVARFAIPAVRTSSVCRHQNFRNSARAPSRD